MTHLVEHAMLDEPPWRFWEEIDEDKYDEGGDQLNAHWNTPLSLTLHEEEAVADELSTSDTKGLETAFNHDCSICQLLVPTQDSSPTYPIVLCCEASHTRTAMMV